MERVETGTEQYGSYAMPRLAGIQTGASAMCGAGAKKQVARTRPRVLRRLPEHGPCNFWQAECLVANGNQAATRR